MIGGPGVAYNINNDRSVFPTSQRPNGGDMMLGAAEAGMPVDFFTFHDVNPCLYLPVCNVTDVRASGLELAGVSRGDSVTRARPVIHSPERRHLPLMQRLPTISKTAKLSAQGLYCKNREERVEGLPTVVCEPALLDFRL